MSILYDYLRVRKRCSRWIPHSLTDEQRRVRCEWCASMLLKFNGGRSELTWEVLTDDETWIYRHDPETRMLSAVWLFPDTSPPQNSKDHAAHRRKWLPISSENRVFWGQTDSHCALVRAPLSPDGLRGLVPAPPKDRTPWPLSSSWQCQCAHSSNNGWLSQWQSDAAAATPNIFARTLLFPELKKHRKSTLFESAEGALRAFTRAVEDIPKLTWAEKWNKRFHRMTKCIAAEGRFFENNGVICCLVSPISNEYPETFGASLRSSRVIKMTIVATPTGRRTVTYLLLISVRTASKWNRTRALSVF